MEDKIKANAEMVQELAQETLGIELGYDEAGVRWLAGYIDRQRDAADEPTKQALRSVLGSYLGECICRTYGGQWFDDAEFGWGVRVSDKLNVFPMNKVKKQLHDANGESVLPFFMMIRNLLNMPSRQIPLSLTPEENGGHSG